LPYYGEDWGSDIVSALVAIAAPYTAATIAKKTGNGLWPTIGEMAVGVGAIAAKHVTRRPYAHEIAEALGYSGLGYAGTWLASVTPTLGGVPAGTVPFSLAARRRAGAGRRAGQAGTPSGYPLPQPGAAGQPNAQRLASILGGL
jgi:hypothetical protein